MLQPNVGSGDRIVRLVLGVALLGLYGALGSPWKYLTLVGLLLVASALSGFSPLYRIFRISTRRD